MPTCGGRLTMPEERAKCCENCWWWVKYRRWEGGWCYLDGSERMQSESCWEWESDRITGDKSRQGGRQ